MLDTWFSSALWPFATLGWPDDTPELRAFYPTSFLTTAREILFLWVARMIMTGIEFAGDDPLPRRLRALGDPGPRRAADVEEPRHRDRPAGGDRRARRRRAALRPAGDVLDPGRALLRRQGPAGPRPRQQALEREPADPAQRRRGRAGAAADCASRTAGSSRGWSARSPRSTEKLEAYDFAHAVQEAYSFFWSELCDWYLEIVKPRLYDGEEEVSATLLYVLERVLALLHPMMPFVTEEIWSFHPARARATSSSHPFPEADESLLDEAAEADVEGGIELTQRPARLARPGRGAGRRRCWRRASTASSRTSSSAASRASSSTADGGEPVAAVGPVRGARLRRARRRGGRGAAREAPRGAARRGRARRAQARQRGLRRQGAGRGGRGGARQARALPAPNSTSSAELDASTPERLPRLARADRLAARAGADAQADDGAGACPSTASPRSTSSAPTASPRWRG